MNGVFGMRGYLTSRPYSERLFPLLLAQFLGVFNDNAFKMLAVLAVIGSSRTGYFRDAAFMFAMTVSYVLPFLLLTGPAGAISDRFQKRYVLILTKFLELLIMILGTFALGGSSVWGALPLIGVMFLMTSQTSFFSPAFQAILPETFSEKEISKANGDIGMASFIAAITGIGAAPLIQWGAASVAESLSPLGFPLINEHSLSGSVLVLGSVLGILSAFRVIPTAEYEKEYSAIRRGAGMIQSLKTGWKSLTERLSIFLAAFGDAFFVGIGVAIQTILVMFVKYTLPESGGSMEIAALQLAPAIGMGLGCYLCGRLSRNTIEVGFVPFGAAGITLFLPLSVYCPGGGVFFGSILLHPLSLLWLILGGISGGFFVIPLRAFLQQRLNPSSRGAALALSNAICFAVVLLTSAVVFLLMIASSELPEGTPRWIGEVVRRMPGLTPPQLFLAIGLLTLGATICCMILRPLLLLRFLAVVLTRTLYRLRISGTENIPERGAALLVSNHVSFVDALLITACTSRTIHFLMHEDYYKHPLIHPFARMMGFIEVPSKGPRRFQTLFETVRNTLRNGEIVCVFPEGKATRNGLIDDFKEGYSRMLPPDKQIPVIPVSLGMLWGSIFSYYYGKIRFRIPRELPCPASVTIGEPMPYPFSAFQLRQAVSELGAESEEVPRDEERTLHYQLAKHAKRHPFRVVFQDYEGKGLTLFQTLVGAVVLSRVIRRLVPDDVRYVGVFLPNMTVSAVSNLAVMMADKVPSPLNFSVSDETLRASIRKSGMTHILTSRRFLTALKREALPEMVFLEDLAKGIPKSSKILWAVLAAVLPHQELMNLVAPVTHRNLFGTAVLLFSSGSTGDPKGVLLSHHNINSDIYSITRVMGWTGHDRILGSLPLFHSFGYTTGFWLPLIVACPVVYVVSPLDAQAVGRAVQKYKLTILLATPTFMQAYLRRCAPEQFDTLRLAIVGAEKLRSDIADKFAEVMNGRIRLVEGYGCTELSPIVAINIGSSILELGKDIGRAGSVGAPMPGICVKIVDPVTGVELPPETDGLMLVKGPNVMQGYLNDPVQTARVLDHGWYDTGDIARMDIDGYITIRGRLSRFSKIAGEMVPHEMLECIMNELSGSEERCIAVTGIPDPVKGEALVVLHTRDLKRTPEEMNSLLRERSIPNLWIPRPQNYWLVDHLPILASGKLDLLHLSEFVAEIQKKHSSSGKF